MPKLPLRELEEARADPGGYRQKMLAPSPDARHRYGYFSAVRDTIHRFHKAGVDRAQARTYLETKLNAFKDSRKNRQALDQFDWYVDEYTRLAWPTVRTRVNVSISLPSRIGESVRCSGQVGRVDLAMTGGYAAWMLRNGTADDWEDELQMPLIQQEVARTLGVSVDSVTMGIYAFQDQTVGLRQFDDAEIHDARRTLNQLLRSLGY